MKNIVDDDIERDVELYSRGKVLSAELNAIDQHDEAEADEFFARLTDFDRDALKYFGNTAVEPIVANIHQHVEPALAEPPLAQPNNNDALIAKIDELINNQLCPSSNDKTSQANDSEPYRSVIERELVVKSNKKLLKKYIGEISINWKPHSVKKSEKTINGRIGLFLEAIGSKPIAELDKNDVSVFKDILRNYPLNRKKINLYKNKTLDVLLCMEIPDRHKIKPVTIKGYANSVTRSLSDFPVEQIL